jgi:hypothetical protein
MNIAYVNIRQTSEYPWQHVIDGIKKCGDVAYLGYPDWSQPINKDTYFITWNNYGSSSGVAERFVKENGNHIVMENGLFLPRRTQEKTYIVNLKTHIPDIHNYNNATNYRWDMFDIKLQPFRNNGEYILICGQRGGKYSDLSMPIEWIDDVIERVSSITTMPIIYRPHPEKKRYPTKKHPNVTIIDSSDVTLEELLKYAFVCLVYTSNCSTHALIQGVPVIYDGPKISCAPLAINDFKKITDPFIPTDQERLRYFKLLCCYNWTESEIKNGEAWRYIKWRTSRC